MIELNMIGFVKDSNFKSRQEVDNSKGWVEWRILDLADKDNVNPEWFYAAACNQYYYDTVANKDGSHPHGYYIQKQFDENALCESARVDFEKLSFKDWDDFYKKMSQEFIYEDDE